MMRYALFHHIRIKSRIKTMPTQIKSTHLLPRMPWSSNTLWTLEWRSFSVLLLSLSCLGIGDGLIVLANLGSNPWTVLSQGIAQQMNISIGFTSLFVSLFVMLFWLPLKLKVGLGTVMNIIIIALFLGLTVAHFPAPSILWGKLSYVLGGILLFGIGSAFYLTCHLGAGPRDGLMVGLCQRFGLKVGLVRTLLEASVCFLGFLLGGTVGIGTLMFALSIGWVIQVTLKQLFKCKLENT